MGNKEKGERGRRVDSDDEEERGTRRKGGRRRHRASESESDEEMERRKKTGGARRRDENTGDDSSEDERRRGRERNQSKKRNSDTEESTDDDDDDRKRKKKDRSKRKSRKRSKRRRESSDEELSQEEEGHGAEGAQVTEEELREFLAKRAQKKAQKLAKRLREKDLSGYTNDSNPFGDTNLTEAFVWRKKIEKDVLTGSLDPRNLTLKKERERLELRKEEIERVKKRRDERLLEKARHEEEMAMLARERARAEFQDWEKKEDEFHFEQSKVRSEIRLREGRAKPIDVLARNLNLSHDFDVEINEPYKIYKGLTVKEMEELKEDIKMHLEYDRNTPLHSEFWTAMMVVCHHEIAEATRRDILDRAKMRGEEPPPEAVAEERGLHTAVHGEVEAALSTRGSKELEEMEQRIQHQMESGGAKLVEYWETVLKRIKVYKAKARLREIHAELLRQHLAILQSTEERRGEDGEEGSWEEDGGGGGGEGAAGGEGAGATGATAPGSYSPELMTEEEAAAEGLVIEEGQGKAVTGEGNKAAGGEAPGSFSPQLIHAYEGEDVVDPEADRAEQELKRAQVMERQQRRLVPGSGPAVPQVSAGGAGGGGTTGPDLTASERAAALKMMGPADGDAILGPGAEVNLESQVYWWHDKYRPRKPKYFNRVHTGYEWNKYNQTHYDHDNPPPKIVQGYKFNIFYPDLIDRSKAPTYSVAKDGSNGETCLIRFHAGPPYEDIAFRIVNKEWEYSHKKGFKCTFDRGILHVYFNFKRYRYRR